MTLSSPCSRNNFNVLITVGKANSDHGISSNLKSSTSELSGVGPKSSLTTFPVKNV